MGLELSEVCVCDVCGWRWLRLVDGMPKRCARPKCRTWKWNQSNRVIGKNVSIPHPPSVQIGNQPQGIGPGSAGDSRVIVSDETKKHPPVREGEDEW